jgi:hypothetical protein
VRGTATYAYETPVEHPAYAQIVQATIARGRVTGVDASAAAGLDGVLSVLTTRNAERLASSDDRELAVLQSGEIAFRGQPVAVVVAETSETARQAAGLVRVTYDEQPHDVELRADRDDLYKPEKVNPAYETDTAEGDVAAAMASAPVTLDRTYTTAIYHNNPLEPHATTALWEPGADVPLTLWDSTQGVHPARSAVAKVFGLDEEQLRVVCPFVGGGFGSKGQPHANVILAAMAARALPGRPVKLALTRQQMFFLAGYRTPTIQRMRLAAGRDGRLAAIAIDVVEQTSRIKEFAEQTGVPTRMMYASLSRRTTHRLAALDVPVPSWMRAPGECPGMFGPEVALDELAGELGIDRRRYLAVDPANRLVAGTLEADWNTTLRALNDAQAAYDQAREQHTGQLTEAQKDRIAQLVTDLPGIWTDPATPMRERKRIARLLLTDVTMTRTSDTITAHVRLAGGQHRTLTLPVPEPAWKIRQTKASTIAEIDKLLDHHTCAEIAGILRRRGLPNGEERPFTRVMVQRVIRTYQLRSRRQRLLDAGLIPLDEMAALLGVSTSTVKIWYHAGIVSGQRYNDKAEVLYHPPGPNPPARHQGRRHDTQRPA